MNSYSLSHLADHVLVRDLKALLAYDRGTTAEILLHLAEVEKRRLYLQLAYPSMYEYCLYELHMSEGQAYKRIRAARAARRVPAILAAVEDGRLHLSAVVLLAPHLKHLSQEAAHELLGAAVHKTRAQLELLLAQRFPQPDLPTLVQAVAAPAPAVQPAETPTMQLAPGPVVPSTTPNAVVPMEPLPPRAKVAPLSPSRYALQVTVDEETHELLRYAQALLGHAVPSGDVAAVLKRALGSLAQELEKKKFAKSARLRTGQGTATGRYVPVAVRSTVWQRDGGQCTFVSEKGKRCEGGRLEFDHIEPVARGGETTTSNLRLRCRAHNQHAADRAFGAGFMDRKRQEARSKTQRGEAVGGATRAASSRPEQWIA